MDGEEVEVWYHSFHRFSVPLFNHGCVFLIIKRHGV